MLNSYPVVTSALFDFKILRSTHLVFSNFNALYMTNKKPMGLNNNALDL